MNGITAPLPCSCLHPGQDKIYGGGIRLHNGCKMKATKEPGWRCTVCLKEKPRQEKVKGDK